VRLNNQVFNNKIIIR